MRNRSKGEAVRAWKACGLRLQTRAESEVSWPLTKQRAEGSVTAELPLPDLTTPGLTGSGPLTFGPKNSRICVCVLVTQSCLSLCDNLDCVPPASLSMEFSRQGYWSE